MTNCAHPLSCIKLSHEDCKSQGLKKYIYIPTKNTNITPHIEEVNLNDTDLYLENIQMTNHLSK